MASIEPGHQDSVVRLRDEDFPNNLRYGSWTDDKNGEYLVPGYMQGSDYSGTLVERSNLKAFRDLFKKGEDKWWTEVSGGHGTFAIVVALKKVPKKREEEVAEFLNGLHEYPLADEDLHSEMEMEAQTEAWENWAAKDFAKALEKKFGVDLDNLDGNAVYEFFNKHFEESNAEWVNEQGGEMYVDIDRIVKSIDEDDIEALEKKHGNIGWAAQQKEFAEQEAEVELLESIRRGDKVSKKTASDLIERGLVYELKGELLVSPAGRAVVADWEKQNG